MHRHTLGAGAQARYLAVVRWRALLSYEAGKFDQALALFAVGSDELDEDASLTGTVASVSERTERQAALAGLRQALPPQRFSSQWREAAAMPFGDVLANWE